MTVQRELIMIVFIVKAKRDSIKEINTPEELHFFYVNILQKGKEVEVKFEV